MYINSFTVQANGWNDAPTSHLEYPNNNAENAKNENDNFAWFNVLIKKKPKKLRWTLQKRMAKYYGDQQTAVIQLFLFFFLLFWFLLCV